MAAGGEIDRSLLMESFSRIKEDIMSLKSELDMLRKENKKILEENLEFKKKLSTSTEKNIVQEDISKIITEAVKKMQLPKKENTNSFFKKINKKRKSFITNRIQLLGEQKNLSLSDVKDIVVDQEGLCSKATFYRYIEKLKNRQIIDFIKINEDEVMIKV